MINPIASNHVSPAVAPAATNSALQSAASAKPAAPKGKGAAVDTVEFSAAALKKAQEISQNPNVGAVESPAQETQKNAGSNASAVQSSVSGAK